MAGPTDDILTTHTGSLPRPDDLIQMIWAGEDGIPIDQGALARRVQRAVQDCVDRQARAGVSIVNDGEMSKPSYATYVKDRLEGFGGESVQNYFFQDLVDYPRSAQMVADNPGRRKRSAPACNAPISVKDAEAARVDMVNLTEAAAVADVAGTFSSAASPGVVSLFFGNEHYATDEEYLFAIAEAMRYEYEAIAESGAIVHHDVDLADIIDLVWAAKPQTILFEAANPRHAHEWTIFEEIDIPEDRVLCPGVIEPQSNYIEHPELVAQRIERYGRLVGRDRIMAGVDCGFSVHVGLQGIDPDVAYAKLGTLAKGAALASRRL